MVNAFLAIPGADCPQHCYRDEYAMKYIQIEIGPWPKLPWWCEMLRKVIPAANPDLEKFFSLTKRWWVELDDEDRAKKRNRF